LKTSVIGTVTPPPSSALNIKPTEIYVFVIFRMFWLVLAILSALPEV